MILFENIGYKDVKINKDTIFVTAIGYEHRSSHLFNTYYSNLENNNVLYFVFDDYKKYPHTVSQAQKMQESGFKPKVVKYESYDEVLNEIIEFIKIKTSGMASIEMHIDYSSMPRSWYCRIPLVISKYLRNSDIAYFWYAEGKYPERYEEFPSAGIDNFSFFSGKPSLKANNNRSHILGLGYDTIRSQAILTVVDPSYLVACYSFPSSLRDVQENVKKVNEQILSQASLSLAFHIDDFSFMVSKLCETANELLIRGDIIFIPDGPKPLILAISLVTELLQKEGITCMHVTRHCTHYSPIDVTATGNIYGFLIRGNIE